MKAREQIREALKLTRGQVRPGRALSAVVLFRNPQREDRFSVNLEDYVRLNRVRDRACWLISLKMPDEFDFFVIPHRVAVGLLDDRPFLCEQSDRKRNPRLFRKAKLNVTIKERPYRFAHAEGELNVEEYLNREDLFRKLVAPHWHLYKERLNDDLPLKQCPRCGELSLTDYGSETHDVQCATSDCRLLWCGDHWAGERRTEGVPSERGWWFYMDSEQAWGKWKGSTR